MDPLVSYIQKEKVKGFSEDLIKEKLTRAGYALEEITTAFQEQERREHYHKFIDKIVEEETKHKWFFVVLVIFLIIFATAFLVTGFLSFEWSDFLQKFSFLYQETVNVEPTTEHDCSIFANKDKERCLLKVAALHDDTSFCVNVTSKVMNYECKTSVWKKNYCNYLILTNQLTESC